MWRLKLSNMVKKQKEASLTVEASLGLPVFVFAVMFFLYFFQFLYLMDSVQSGITETGKFLSRYEGVMGKSELSEVTKQFLVRQKFYEYLDKENICTECITGGIYGITVTLSESVENKSEIEITAIYQIRFPIPFFGEKKSLVMQKVKTRAFVGQVMKCYQEQEENGNREEAKEKEMVYVAENGSVYHLSENCSHLKLSISIISARQIEDARNQSGSRYKACEKCVGGNKAEEVVYIAKDGERYHNLLSCSGLKRTIYFVPYSEVEGKRKCSRCY